MYEIVVDTRIASVKRREKITAGSVGIQCNFMFSADWNGFTRTAVFETDNHKIITELDSSTVTVPWEVCEEAGLDVIVGVYGKNEAGTIVIPTIYAKLDTVSVGTTTGDADNALPAPTPSDVEQIRSIAANASSTASSANATADRAKQIAEHVQARADAGDFDGADGFSPDVTAYRDGNAVTISVTSKDATKAVTVYDGKDGEAGKDGAPLTIVNRIYHIDSDRPNWETLIFSDGSELAVMSGKNGVDGQTPFIGVNGNWWIPGKPQTNTIVPAIDTGKPSRGENGAPGTPGRDGTDGTSVSITNISESAESGGTSVVTFSDGKTLSVKNGRDGQGGEGGTTVTDEHIKEVAETESIKASIADLEAQISDLPSGGSGLSVTAAEALCRLLRSAVYKTPNASPYLDTLMQDLGVTLEDEAIPAERIILSKTSLTFNSNDPQTLTATIVPADSTDVLTWESDNNDICTVIGGVLTPVSNGECNIIARAGNVSASCRVDVNIIERPLYTFPDVVRNFSGGEDSLEVTSDNHVKIVTIGTYAVGVSTADKYADGGKKNAGLGCNNNPVWFTIPAGATVRLFALNAKGSGDLASYTGNVVKICAPTGSWDGKLIAGLYLTGAQIIAGTEKTVTISEDTDVGAVCSTCYTVGSIEFDLCMYVNGVRYI